jgi:hypothetical protein
MARDIGQPKIARSLEKFADRIRVQMNKPVEKGVFRSPFERVKLVEPPVQFRENRFSPGFAGHAAENRNKVLIRNKSFIDHAAVIYFCPVASTGKSFMVVGLVVKIFKWFPKSISVELY